MVFFFLTRELTHQCKWSVLQFHECANPRLEIIVPDELIIPKTYHITWNIKISYYYISFTILTSFGRNSFVLTVGSFNVNILWYSPTIYNWQISISIDIYYSVAIKLLIEIYRFLEDSNWRGYKWKFKGIVEFDNRDSADTSVTYCTHQHSQFLLFAWERGNRWRFYNCTDRRR